MRLNKIMSSSSSNDSDDGSQTGDVDKKISACLRKAANISQVKTFMLLDTDIFDKDLAKLYFESSAPKLMALISKIKELDEADMKKHKKLFKHMIFTDADNTNYGAKLIASLLVSYGFSVIFTRTHQMKTDANLSQSKGNNFGLLLSKKYSDKSMNEKFKKAQMHKFNERPSNTHGDLVRFMILDQGFKEGIDLYDVKYVHLLEPLVSRADEKQAIGRSTRFCGQKGLEFHPRSGWPLNVFRYDVKANIDGTQTLFELYLKYKNINMTRVVFAAELEKLVTQSAIDVSLTEEIHSFKIEDPLPIISHSRESSPVTSGGVPVTRSRAKIIKQKEEQARFLKHDQMQKHIKQEFGQFKYPKAKFENMCVEATKLNEKVQFTPTQDFIRHYFTPATAYKGILLYHSVGSGKTCTAIATATTSFEKEGYTILWVTRHTLKSDIWKNMFEQICNMSIQEKLEKGQIKIPKKVSGPMKYLSKNWMKPISYKQFSNLLLKNNKYYDEIIKINGKDDPLRKTLLVIDEAHKLYAQNVSAPERPNINILENMIENSYRKSGNDSVRIMLMTATPYTSDGMEMIKLLNLLRERNKAFPDDFNDFGNKYLDSDGYFTDKGATNFKNEITGYISYLDRSKDARYFAHPVIQNIYVNISDEYRNESSKHVNKEIDSIVKELKELRLQLKEGKLKVKEDKGQMCGDIKTKIAECKEKLKEKYAQLVSREKDTKKLAFTRCNALAVKDRAPCKSRAKEVHDSKMDEYKTWKAQETKSCNNIKKTCDANITKGVVSITEKITSLKERKVELKEILTDYQTKRKEAREQIITLKGDYKNLQSTKKQLREELSKLAKEIKAASNKEELKQRQKVIRNEVKKIVEKIREVRNEIKGIQITQKTNGLKVGKLALRNVPQQSAVFKCLNIKK